MGRDSADGRGKGRECNVLRKTRTGGGRVLYDPTMSPSISNDVWRSLWWLCKCVTSCHP